MDDWRRTSPEVFVYDVTEHRCPECKMFLTCPEPSTMLVCDKGHGPYFLV